MKKWIMAFLIIAIGCIYPQLSGSATDTPLSDFHYKEVEDHIEITKYVGTDETVVIPNKIDGKFVTTIGRSAFESTVVKQVTLPKKLAVIKNEAFKYTKLTSIHFPASLEVIADNAFFQAGLNEITFENTTQPLTIGKMAFGLAKIERVDFPEGLVSIGDRAFLRAVQLKEATFPTTLQTIDYQAFANLSLEKIVLREGLQTIETRAFYNNHIRYITIPKSVTKVGQDAFSKQTVGNLPPVITAPATFTVSVGEKINATQQMTAFDEEDGDLTDQVYIKMPSTKVPGRYEMMYSVTDSFEQKTTFTNIVYVKPRTVKAYAYSESKALRVSWDMPDDVTGNKVYVYDANGKLLRTEKTTSTSLTIGQLTPGTVYRIKVRAYVKTADKTLLSDYSKAIEMITLPAKPTLTVKAASKAFKASWTKSATATKYQLQYSLKKEFKDTFDMTVSSKTTAKNVKGLKKGKTYYVRIRAIQPYKKQSVYGEWSTVKKVVTK